MSDPLNEVLSTLQLRSAVLYQGRAAAPWGFRFTPREYGCPGEPDTGAADASFHFIASGQCLLQLDGDSKITLLEAGDFVVFPQGSPHSLRDARDSAVYPIEEKIASAHIDETGMHCYEGDGPETVLLCGKFYFDQGATNPLLRALPPVLLTRPLDSRAVDWLDKTLAFMACEATSGRPGAQTVISRLADILFIQAIRAHLSGLADSEPGLLRVLADTEIGPVVQAVHKHPEQAWTVSGMAKRACLSRSAFAARFTALVGEPPLQYVTRWRVHTAATLLKEGATLADVAERVGYESEAAFGKAFKRWTGAAPGAFRRHPAKNPVSASPPRV